MRGVFCNFISEISFNSLPLSPVTWIEITIKNVATHFAYGLLHQALCRTAQHIFPALEARL